MTKTTEATFTDFQRLEWVQIAPHGALVAISGRNAQGKTSVLEGLEATFMGHSKRDVPRPVRDGQKTAEVVNVLDNGLTLIRKYKADGSSSLTAKAKDGSKVSQATLSGMLGAFGMSTGVFDLMDDKKQLAAVLDIVKLDFNPSELSAERAGIFEKRTFINHKVKELTAQISRFLELPEDLPAEETSVAALAEEIRAAEALERAQQADIQGLEQHGRRLDELDRQIAELQRQRQTVLEDATSLRAVIDSHQPLLDVDDLRLRMANAEDTNAMVRVAKEKAQLQFQLDVTQDQALQMTAQIEGLDKRKADGLAAADFPVEGMTFDEEGVLLNGRPFRKGSTRERTLAAARLIIASDPELRVMTVPNGNDLDSEGLAELEALGDEHNWQIWAEFVDESGEFGWTIEDGKVA
ncbi:hypothetical protein DQ353_00390 [Arthrobacter sp. AQ5-05]|uniref:AAA family ATPase n=1 Tax=Arthrobacter sp. AQ5-05 TaxID=2184581 RepID=UPI000DCD7324|nr:AAA family ATPase [Arthrobacter sp. AQ5-05]RAX50895.1 hypothetical protein DQ353_00390 [Arthrobacter sp. AQ5-05]